MTLCEYLNKYFPNGEQGTFEEKPVDLTSHFILKFGVDVKKEDDLFLFKYNMISANFCFPITHECRGIIFRFNEKWEVVSRPYSKFFNFHEGYCSIREADFQPNLRIIEKADGTCIQTYFDDKQDKWRISTLGTITTQSFDQAFRPNETFADLFLKTVKVINWDRFDKGYTYLFELCTHDNRIITQYITDVLYIVAVREKHYGIYKTDQEVDELWLDMTEDGSNVKRPVMKFLSDLNLNNFSEVVNWVEDQAEGSQYGKYPEGFVIYRGGVPVAKLKNKKYLAAFHVSGGNKGHAKNSIIDQIFTGNLDDVYAMMIPELQQFADKIKGQVVKLGVEILEVSREIGKENCPTQKDYALAVQRYCHNRLLQPFLYQNKLAAMSGGNINELFTIWIKDNYKRFLDLWKVQEDPKDNRE